MTNKRVATEGTYDGDAGTRPTKRTGASSGAGTPALQHYSSKHDSPRAPVASPPTQPPQPLQVVASTIRDQTGNSEQSTLSNPYVETDAMRAKEGSTIETNVTPASHRIGEKDTGMLKQPETRPITQEQLVNEVKGIYAGLVMVEKKCVEICQQQSQTTNKLSNEQWQALISLHRTLLHEHHDFFLASQHPTASPALRRLATKYAMPARMWRHGIHSFLELLRHRLPDSLDHMLAFVYLAYSMMALLMESVPSFVETWIECLGDLARYRMAIEEADLRDREIWSNVARMWYNKAADKSPNVGRIQHHLAVLARPNIVQQLFYYSKSLVSTVPFVNARESVMLLFTPFLEKTEATYQKYPHVESALVTAYGIVFTRGSISDFIMHVSQFSTGLDGHIARTSSKFKVQGPEIASSLIAGIYDFGTDENFLWKTFRAHEDAVKAGILDLQDPSPSQVASTERAIKLRIHRDTWKPTRSDETASARVLPASLTQPNSKFSSSEEVVSYAAPVFEKTITIVAQRIGDKNIVPFMHVVLAFIWSLTFVPGALVYLEPNIPWDRIVMFLNTLGRSGVIDSRIESEGFPQVLSGTGRQLPEDFPMRGLIWAQHYYPTDFFTTQVVDEDERTLELPSHAAPRAERCLWLGIRLSTVSLNTRRRQHQTDLFCAVEPVPIL